MTVRLSKGYSPIWGGNIWILYVVLTGHDGVVYDPQQEPELPPQDRKHLFSPRKKGQPSGPHSRHYRPCQTALGTNSRSHFEHSQRSSRILVLLVENQRTSCVHRWQIRIHVVATSCHGSSQRQYCSCLPSMFIRCCVEVDCLAVATATLISLSDVTTRRDWLTSFVAPPRFDNVALTHKRKYPHSQESPSQ